MAAKKTATKSKSKKAAPAPDPVDEELEEVDGDEVEETGTKKGGQEEVTFGASDLAKHLSEKSGKAVSARELRTLIRKMARDGSKRVNREIVPGNRSRYNWSGLDDPEVKAIIAAFEGGELEADKKEKLDALKARKAEKKAAKDKADKGKKGKKGKKSEPVATDDDDEDLELDDDE
jgi:hypothetical protein